MLHYAIIRCASICSNLNSETLGNERGPDCARRIEKEANTLIQETLSVVQSPVVIDTCEQGHSFPKLHDHPKRDGMSRCPHCMAAGLDAAREEIKRLELRPRSALYDDTISWLGSEEGKKSLAVAMTQADKSIELLNKERRVDSALLHQPFGLEYDVARAMILEGELSIARISDAALDREMEIEAISRFRPMIGYSFLKKTQNRIPRLRDKCFSSVYFWLIILAITITICL